MQWDNTGVTRHVLLTQNYAIKIVRIRGAMGFVRAYLANQSEWHQRERPNINPPLGTILHLVTWYKRAIYVGDWEPEDAPWFACNIAATRSYLLGRRTDIDGEPQNHEERKGSAWGFFLERGEMRWLLIDYDRAWAQPRRGILCRLYYANEERKARKWMNLPYEEERTTGSDA